jgi:hypothetical protein
MTGRGKQRTEPEGSDERSSDLKLEARISSDRWQQGIEIRNRMDR